MPEVRDSFDVVVRPASEMTLKRRRTRQVLRRRLRANIRDGLSREGMTGRVASRLSRLIISVDVADDGPEVTRERVRDVLSRMFGVGSFSFTLGTCAPELDEIVEVGRALFASRVQGRRYAVRCKRMGRHAFRSVDVERALGAALNPGARVDLDDPEVTVALEVDEERATFFSERMPGPGGLPLGVGGRALALMSGGYDSAVAAWMLMKRGIEVDFVFFRIGGEATERLALQVAKVLSDRWAAGTRPELYSVDFGAVVDDLRASAGPSHWQVVLKRQMLRAADALADEAEAASEQAAAAGRPARRWRQVDALITGESVGQVSSQTLGNLRVIHDAARRPVLRPLVGMDKTDIIAYADRVGTGPLSARVRESCAIAVGRTETRAHPDRVAANERGLHQEVLRDAVAQRRAYALRALTSADLVLPFLFTDDVPDGAELVDCSVDGAGGWRPAGTRVVPAPTLLAGRADLDKDATYVLFCRFGTQSAHAAEVLQQLGYEAYAFRGGMPALRRALEGGPPGRVAS